MTAKKKTVHVKGYTCKRTYHTKSKNSKKNKKSSQKKLF